MDNYTVMGYTFRSKDTFASVPGLVSQVDSRFLVQENAEETILNWRDVNNHLFIKNNVLAQKPTYANRQIVFENDAGTQAKVMYADLGNGDNLNFLVDGSPFGFYKIEKNRTNLSEINVTVIASPSPSGAVYFGTRIENNSDFKIQIRNDASTVINVFSKTSFIPDDQFYSIGLVRKSTSDANNFVLSKNGLIDSTTTNGVTNSSNIKGLRLGGQDINARIRKTSFGLMLFYNWTGFTESEITAFDVRVRALINEARTEFNSL